MIRSDSLNPPIETKPFSFQRALKHELRDRFTETEALLLGCLVILNAPAPVVKAYLESCGLSSQEFLEAFASLKAKLNLQIDTQNTLTPPRSVLSRIGHGLMSVVRLVVS